MSIVYEEKRCFCSLIISFIYRLLLTYQSRLGNSVYPVTLPMAEEMDSTALVWSECFSQNLNLLWLFHLAHCRSLFITLNLAQRQNNMWHLVSIKLCGLVITGVLHQPSTYERSPDISHGTGQEQYDTSFQRTVIVGHSL